MHGGREGEAQSLIARAKWILFCLQRAGDIVQRWRKRDAAEALAAFAEYAAHRRRKRTADAMSRRSRARTALQAWREYMKLRTAEGFWSRSRLNGEAESAQERRAYSKLGRFCYCYLGYMPSNAVRAAMCRCHRGMAALRQPPPSAERGKSPTRALNNDDLRVRHTAPQPSMSTAVACPRSPIPQTLLTPHVRIQQLGAQLWGRTRRGRLASALSSWRDYATYSARLKTVSNAVRGRLQRSTVGGVFAAWRSEAKQMAALKALLERVLVRTAALAFYGWR